MKQIGKGLYTLESYISLAAQKAVYQKDYFTGPLGNDVFQFSPMP